VDDGGVSVHGVAEAGIFRRIEFRALADGASERINYLLEHHRVLDAYATHGLFTIQISEVHRCDIRAHCERWTCVPVDFVESDDRLAMRAVKTFHDFCPGACNRRRRMRRSLFASPCPLIGVTRQTRVALPHATGIRQLFSPQQPEMLH
jgi:hypothetical protein